jgi:hypothetical protein
MTLYVIGNSWWAAGLWSATGEARPWHIFQYFCLS